MSRIFLAITLVNFAHWADAGTDRPLLKKAVVDIVKEVRPEADVAVIDKFEADVPVFDPNLKIQEKVKLLATYLFSQLNLKADTSFESRANKDNILPDAVLENKQGHCLGLSILFMIAAEKRDLKAYLMRVPEHVFARICDQNGCANAEMLKQGQIFENDFYVKNKFIDKRAIEQGLYLKPLSGASDVAASIYLGLGYAANNANQKELAETYYRKAIERAPSFAEAHANLGALLGDNGNSDKMKNELIRAEELNPFLFSAQVNLGLYWLREKDYKMAKGYFERAIKLNPVSPVAYINLAGCLEHERKFKDALLNVDMALALVPSACAVIEKRLALAKKVRNKRNHYWAGELERLKSSNACATM